MASHGTIAFTLENMVPGKAGAALPRPFFTSDDGVLLCYGTTVPTDGAAGYAPACHFFKVDGGALGTVLYVNIGTKAACNFDPWAGSVTQQAHIPDPAACAAMTATLAGVDTGTDMTAAQAATLVADLAALRTAVEAHKAKLIALLAALETAGVLAAV